MVGAIQVSTCIAIHKVSRTSHFYSKWSQMLLSNGITKGKIQPESQCFAQHGINLYQDTARTQHIPHGGMSRTTDILLEGKHRNLAKLPKVSIGIDSTEMKKG